VLGGASPLPGFYSKLERAVEELPRAGKAGSFLNLLKKKGVSSTELSGRGVEAALSKNPQQMLEREDVARTVKPLEINRIHLSGDTAAPFEDNDPLAWMDNDPLMFQELSLQHSARPRSYTVDALRMPGVWDVEQVAKAREENEYKYRALLKDVRESNKLRHAILRKQGGYALPGEGRMRFTDGPQRIILPQTNTAGPRLVTNANGAMLADTAKKFDLPESVLRDSHTYNREAQNLRRQLHYARVRREDLAGLEQRNPYSVIGDPHYGNLLDPLVTMRTNTLRLQPVPGEHVDVRNIENIQSRWLQDHAAGKLTGDDMLENPNLVVPSPLFADNRWMDLGLKQQLLDVAHDPTLGGLSLTPGDYLKVRGETAGKHLHDTVFPDRLDKLLKPYGVQRQRVPLKVHRIDMLDMEDMAHQRPPWDRPTLPPPEQQSILYWPLSPTVKQQIREKGFPLLTGALLARAIRGQTTPPEQR
jgi:hypothetical protein